MFDPCSFYGHNEFDLAMLSLFNAGGEFFHQYHLTVRKQSKYAEREKLYQISHLLTLW